MIAIKDVKMPVNCEECFARILAWCLLDEEERMVIPALPDESFEGRPEWCPLVEVPDEAGNCSEFPNNSDGEYDPKPDIYYLAEKIGIHRLYALVVQLRGEPESCIDTISRRAAVEAIANQSRFSAEEIINICDKSVQDENGWLGGLKEAILAVLELPSAQPERKKGEWIIDEDCEGKSRTVICNLCGHEEFNWHNPNFCPNCGADMRGEQDE